MRNLSNGLYNIIDNEGINESIRNVLDSKNNYYTYASPKGLKELREQICNFINEDNEFKSNYSNMIITSCGQQSLNLISYALLEEGDTILIEEPTYFGAIDVFKKRKLNIVGIEITKKGINLEELEEKIKRYKPKMICVVPTFNNPTGYVWEDNLRKDFLAIINKYNMWIVEDDPYSLINFTNKKYHSLYDLNKGEKVIYLGTFSKYISPSINVGYILCNNDIMINKLYEYKDSFDLCTSLFIQYVILDYLKNNNLRNIIKNKIKLYKRQYELAKEYLNSLYKDKIISYTDMKGGLFFLVYFKDKINDCNLNDCKKFYIDSSKGEKIVRINICSIEKEI